MGLLFPFLDFSVDMTTLALRLEVRSLFSGIFQIGRSRMALFPGNCALRGASVLHACRGAKFAVRAAFAGSRQKGGCFAGFRHVFGVEAVFRMEDVRVLLLFAVVHSFVGYFPFRFNTNPVNRLV